MKGISKNTTIILLVVLCIGIIGAAVFGFLTGMQLASSENVKQDFVDTVDKIENKIENKEIKLEVVANSEIEFVTDIRNTFDKFSKNDCNIYIIKYNNIIVTITGENIVGTTGNIIRDLSIEIDGTRINKELEHAKNVFGYKNNLDVAYMSDGTNTLFTIIANVNNSKQQDSSYIISFNQLGDVVLNEENEHNYYSIGSTIENNIEVNNIINIYSLGDYVYGNDMLNTCSEDYLNMIKDYPAETLVYSKKIYGYVDNTLSIISEENRTIAEDKVQKVC